MVFNNSSALKVQHLLPMKTYKMKSKCHTSIYDSTEKKFLFQKGGIRAQQRRARLKQDQHPAGKTSTPVAQSPASEARDAVNWASKAWPSPLLPSAAHTVPLLSQLHSMPAALLSVHPMVLVPLLPSGLHGALGFSSIQCLLKGTFRDSNPVVHCLSSFLSESMGQNSGTTFSLYFPCLKTSTTWAMLPSFAAHFRCGSAPPPWAGAESASMC